MSVDAVEDLGERGFCPFCGATIHLSRPPADLLSQTGAPTTPRQPAVHAGLVPEAGAPRATEAWSPATELTSEPDSQEIVERLVSPRPSRPPERQAPPIDATPVREDAGPRFVSPRPSRPPTPAAELPVDAAPAPGDDVPTSDFGKAATVAMISPAVDVPDPFAPIDAGDADRSYSFDPLGGEASLLDSAWSDPAPSKAAAQEEPPEPEPVAIPAPGPDPELELEQAFGWSSLGPGGGPQPVDEDDLPLEEAPIVLGESAEEPEPQLDLDLDVDGAAAPLGPDSIEELLDLASTPGTEQPALVDMGEPDLELDLRGPQDLSVIRDLPAQPMEVGTADDDSAPDLFAQLDGEILGAEEEPRTASERLVGMPPGGSGRRWRIESEGPDGTPLELGEMLRRIREGELSPGDRVAEGDGGDWVAIEAAPALRRYVGLYGRQSTPPGTDKDKRGFWQRLKGR